ncbi:hypothetical protein [Aeromonas diversa]|uniref:hypothetical protein n=1 Tax=Aeromonas diversa TaxID=502790 RepID=UPI003462E42A
MQFLIIEETPLLSTAICLTLRKHGLGVEEMMQCKDLHAISSFLHRYHFDAIICRQSHYQGYEGIRLLQEADYQTLLPPGVVLLLLNEDPAPLTLGLSTIHFELQLTIPFTSQSLDDIAQELISLTRVTRPLCPPLRQQEWGLTLHQCEDIQFRLFQHPLVRLHLDRLKGMLLLQQRAYLDASQHYALCATEYPASWPRCGLFLAMIGLGRMDVAQRDLELRASSLSEISLLKLTVILDVQEGRWFAAKLNLEKLLQQQHHPDFRHAAILLAILLHDVDMGCNHIAQLNLTFFPEGRLRLSVEQFMLEVALKLLWQYSALTRDHSLSVRFQELGPLSPPQLSEREAGVLQAFWSLLDSDFDGAITRLTTLADEENPAPSALLLEFAISHHCTLAQRALQCLDRLATLQPPTPFSPLLGTLMHRTLESLRQFVQEEEGRLEQLRSARNDAIRHHQWQRALQLSITLCSDFPAYPAEAWATLNLLSRAWPGNAPASQVASLVESLTQRLDRDAEFQANYGERYGILLGQIHRHLDEHLPS